MMKKLHNFSLHALNFCAVATLTALAVNILSALGLFLADRKTRGN